MPLLVLIFVVPPQQTHESWATWCPVLLCGPALAAQFFRASTLCGLSDVAREGWRSWRQTELSSSLARSCSFSACLPRCLELSKAAVCGIWPQERRTKKVVFSSNPAGTFQLDDILYMLQYTLAERGKSEETPKALRSDHRSWLCTLLLQHIELLMPHSLISGKVSTWNCNLQCYMGLCKGHCRINVGSVLWNGSCVPWSSGNSAKVASHCGLFWGFCRIPWQEGLGCEAATPWREIFQDDLDIAVNHCFLWWTAVRARIDWKFWSNKVAAAMNAGRCFHDFWSKT